MKDFHFVMISAGFEHGGNVIHRHLDGHPQLLVYPFESQLGNHSFSDFLASVERVQYRYPEFPEGLQSHELYEQIIDEELKTLLRKRKASKFRDVDLAMDEDRRKTAFCARLQKFGYPFRRKHVIEAFFRSTFDAWENYHIRPAEDMAYVGYSPVIGIDSNRLVHDFPKIRIAHIVRNPFSAYRDTKRRPFPQNIHRYLITWNLYHSTVNMYACEFPQNVRILRYEDLVENKAKFMRNLAEFIGVDFHPAMLYPSWNGRELDGSIAPWGTVQQSTLEYNRDIIEELADEEIRTIANATRALATHFGYTSINYLRARYAQ